MICLAASAMASANLVWPASIFRNPATERRAVAHAGAGVDDDVFQGLALLGRRQSRAERLASPLSLRKIPVAAYRAALRDPAPFGDHRLQPSTELSHSQAIGSPAGR